MQDTHFMYMNEFLKQYNINSYEQLWEKVKSKKMDVRLDVVGAMKVSSLTKPFISSWGYYIGFIITSALLIFYSIQNLEYEYLILIILNLILAPTIRFFSKIYPIALIVEILGIFVKIPTIIMVICFDFILMYIVYCWWEKLVVKNAMLIIEKDREFFVTLWNGIRLFLIDENKIMHNSYSDDIILVSEETEEKNDKKEDNSDKVSLEETTDKIENHNSSKYCTNCGTKINESWKYCQKCGEKIE